MKSCKDCIHRDMCEVILLSLARQGFATPKIDECTGNDCLAYLNEHEAKKIKQGLWKVHIFSNKKFIECPICNAVIDCSTSYIDENEYDYCPYCGSYMKAGAENG